MTRYALLTEFGPPDHGGIQATVGPIIEALGQDVTVIAPQKAIASQHRIVRSLFSGTSWPRWSWLVQWLRKAQREGLEIVIFGHFSAAVYSGLVARKLFGLPYGILIHGNDLLTEECRWPSRLLIGVCLRRAKFVGINSDFVLRLVRKYNVPAIRIVRTHPFVLTAAIPKNTVSTVGSRLVTVARLVPRKNIASLLHSVVEVQKHISDVHLDIIGDGPERQRLEMLTQQLGLSTTVQFHGAVSEEKKWEVVQAAKIFVMAPIVRQHGVDVEGLGLAYLEAAVCGLPIIASDTGGVRDAVVDGQTGLLVDPEKPAAVAEAIITLLKNPDRAQLLGQAGQQRVLNEFTDVARLTRLMTLLGRTAEDSQPVVSIIIPAYNSADTIAATLRSVQQQTWKKYEVIVVDDGSTDNLEGALQPHIFDITFIRQNNSGAPVARNVGFDHSRGEYVIFLDADVILDPTAIEQMVQSLITHPTAVFTYSDYYFGWKKFHLFEYSSAKLRKHNYIHTSSLIRRQSFVRFDPSLKRFQDWDLWLTMDAEGKYGIWIPQVLFRVLARPNNVGMSRWLPSFMYTLPGIGRGRGNATIAKYRQAEAVIRQKHAL